MPAELIQVEITESALTADPAQLTATIDRLTAAGVAISLDDFGTGYSSLQHLRRLPLAEIKIDRSFVAGMAHDADDAVIVRSTVELARALGLRVVAEGVENQHTAELLAEAGCGAGPGLALRPADARRRGDGLADPPRLREPHDRRRLTLPAARRMSGRRTYCSLCMRAVTVR